MNKFKCLLLLAALILSISACSLCPHNGRVVVENTPLPVTLAGIEGKEPYVLRHMFTLVAENYSENGTFYVPEGKRLEIEFISISRAGYTPPVEDISSAITFTLRVGG